MNFIKTNLCLSKDKKIREATRVKTQNTYT